MFSFSAGDFTLSVLVHICEAEFSFAPRSVTSLPRRQLMNLHNNEAGRRVSFDFQSKSWKCNFCVANSFWYMFSLPWGLFCHVVWGVAPSSNIYKSNSPSTRPPPVKEPNLPNKAGACFIGAHHCQKLTTTILIIIAPWLFWKYKFMKVMMSFCEQKIILPFFRRWSRTWRWLYPSLPRCVGSIWRQRWF